MTSTLRRENTYKLRLLDLQTQGAWICLYCTVLSIILLILQLSFGTTPTAAKPSGSNIQYVSGLIEALPSDISSRQTISSSSARRSSTRCGWHHGAGQAAEFLLHSRICNAHAPLQQIAEGLQQPSRFKRSFLPSAPRHQNMNHSLPNCPISISLSWTWIMDDQEMSRGRSQTLSFQYVYLVIVSGCHGGGTLNHETSAKRGVTKPKED